MDEDDFANPFGVFGQKDFEGVELLRHAFDVVEAVDTNDEFDTFEFALEGSNTFLDLGGLQAFDEFIRVNADGECSDCDEASVPVYAVGCCGGVEDPRAAAEKVAGIVVCVEADEVAVEKTRQQRLPYRQNTVDFTTGEWRMQEEADLNVLLGVADFLTQHLRQEHQVVVVYPDEISVLHILDDGLRKQAVDFLVGGPG